MYPTFVIILRALTEERCKKIRNIRPLAVLTPISRLNGTRTQPSMQEFRTDSNLTIAGGRDGDAARGNPRTEGETFAQLEDGRFELNRKKS